MDPIQVRMLGCFTLQFRDKLISDTDNRAKKVWSLLAYLLCSRGQIVPQQKLIDLLWSDDTGSNPENALRITAHRLRSLLDRLWPGAGRELILGKDGGYGWNAEAEVLLDCDRFEELCLRQTEDPGRRLEDLTEALDLYRGEFLPRQASEMWTVSVSTHFQNRFLTASMEAARLLGDAGRHTAAVEVCRRAAAAEPYHEPLHQLLMQSLAAAGDPKGAGAVYESLSRRLFDDFGIRPNEQTRSVYRICAHSPQDRTLPMDEVLEHLQEPQASAGAMECDYDYFKVLCYAESRAMERSGKVTHVALLSLTGTGDRPLTKRSTGRIMDQLSHALRMNLRRGDTISRCSVSQYIIMLPAANYEDSCMVCRRIIAAFHRAHPQVAAKVNFMVQPLTPGICVP
ncbi:MAG: winged helix-turn-helix domain-containing protein [Oscillospiraceae bacterium]|nr:winged helix-turn-helix domain-containing protein [Oscillospiraceae bacterium]